MSFTFKGGIHPDYRKEISKLRKIEAMPSQDMLIFPMSQHIGVPCKPCVAVGDYVKMGQMIGEPSAGLSSPIHSSVSGNVIAIEPRHSPMGGEVLSVVIKNDHNDFLLETIKPFPMSIDDITCADLITLIKNAGIVGMGGAAFPTHVKVSSAQGKVDTLIVNGAECEPYLTNDHRLMLENSKDIIKGAKLLAKCIVVKKILVAIEDNKIDAVKHFRELCKNEKNIEIKMLKTKYPQGGEKQLIKALTGREVPTGKLPVDVHCVVFNVSTCVAVWSAYSTGMPLIERVVTVSGSGISAPKNLLARIGTPFSELVKTCAGYSIDPYKIISGGPMMGLAQYTDQVPVLKNTSGILALSADECEGSKTTNCIRCGRCGAVCPMKLSPNYYALYVENEMPEQLEELNITDCIECGSCSFICPAHIPLVQYIRLGKVKLMEYKKK